MLIVREPICEGMTREWRIHEVVAHKQTKYQNVLIARTDQGISLFCDYERQSTELTQLIYHEAQIVPAMLLCKPKPKRVLVLGSSEGVVSRMAIALGAEQVLHVDIDREAVQMCAIHLPYGYSNKDLSDFATAHGQEFASWGKDTPPIQIVFGDGHKYIMDRTLKFDVIVLDLPDMRPAHPDDQVNYLYTKDFFRQCERRLAKGGVFITQAGNPSWWRHSAYKDIVQRMKAAFESVVVFDMPEQDWSWAMGTDEQWTMDTAAEKMITALDDLSPDAQATIKHIDADVISKAVIPVKYLRDVE